MGKMLEVSLVEGEGLVLIEFISTGIAANEEEEVRSRSAASSNGKTKWRIC